MVGEVGMWEESEWHWRLRWRRIGFVWESLQEDEMFKTISVVNLNREEKDLQVWDGDASGVFSVKSAYGYLSNQVGGCHNGVFIQLWKAKAFPNVLSTACRILLDRIPTRSSLNRRVLVSTTSCALCQGKIETAQHLFLECEFASVCGLCALDGFCPT